MREVQAPDAKARLTELLGEVERGESIVITRHGRPIARLVPDMERRRKDLETVFLGIDALDDQSPGMTLDEIMEARHEGHKY